jgi:hypothetical protein
LRERSKQMEDMAKLTATTGTASTGYRILVLLHISARSSGSAPST